VAAGFFTDSTQFTAIANSNGVFGYQQDTGLDFT
jgi:predicted Zn-dependent protease